MSILRRTAPSRGRRQERMSHPVGSGSAGPATLRERLTRLGAPPRARPRVEAALPRGFEVLATPHGRALLRQDVIPLPALEPNPGSVAYIDTETTGLSSGAGTYVFAAAVARPIDCGLRVAQLLLPQPGLEAAFLYALRS